MRKLGYVEIQSSEILDVKPIVIDAINKVRADRRETCIEKLMKPKTTGMLWWKSTISISRQEAEELADKPEEIMSSIGSYSFKRAHQQYAQDTINAIETLASVAEKQNSMLVDIETWDTIMSWTK